MKSNKYTFFSIILLFSFCINSMDNSTSSSSVSSNSRSNSSRSFYKTVYTQQLESSIIDLIGRLNNDQQLKELQDLIDQLTQYLTDNINIIIDDENNHLLLRAIELICKPSISTSNIGCRLVKYLIDKNIDVNIQDIYGKSALSYLANYYIDNDITSELRKKHILETINLLISSGADISSLKQLSQVQYDKKKIVKRNYLLGCIKRLEIKLIDIVNKDIVNKGDIGLAKKLLKQKVSADTIDELNHNKPILVIAAEKNNLPIVELLLEAGADIDLTDNNGFNFRILMTVNNDLKNIYDNYLKKINKIYDTTILPKDLYSYINDCL